MTSKVTKLTLSKSEAFKGAKIVYQKMQLSTNHHGQQVIQFVTDIPIKYTNSMILAVVFHILFLASSYIPK